MRTWPHSAIKRHSACLTQCSCVCTCVPRGPQALKGLGDEIEEDGRNAF